jgi:hypothetical protein
MRVKGTQAWDGRAWFEGSFPVKSVRTEVVQQGPVFADFKITYEFVDNGEDGEKVTAMPLQLGKQSYRWAPNEFAREEIPRRTKSYEVALRFVMDDPWIDINERYVFPRDPDNEPWGVVQYWMQWGNPKGAPPLAWFSGQEHMPVDTITWVRWFLWDQFGGNTDQQYVEARARPDQKGRPFALLRPRWNQGGGGAQDFFMTSGGRPARKERQRIDGRNEMVEVPGDPGYNPDNPAVGLVAAFASKWVGPFPATIATYADDGNRGRARFPLIDGERSGFLYGQRAYAICVGPRRMFTNLNNLVRRHTDWTLVAQNSKYILDWDRGGEPKDMRLPSAELFLNRRYQDDFLNPTSRATRDLKQLAEARRQVGKGPIGGPINAALGYIFVDPDHWPGWHNGWLPGNPNFHTDKYMGAVFAASAFPEHPHSHEWLEYGWLNFQEDMGKVLLPPDGVGFECPGYAGYALSLQLNVMRELRDNGKEEALNIPLVLKSGRWHRHLTTPYDVRLHRRHAAPIGDTHRWDSGLGDGFGKLAYLYQKKDPAFAAEMLGTEKLLLESGADSKVSSEKWLDGAKIHVAPMDPAKMEWGSHAFRGFGTISRNNFGTNRETFLSIKAGETYGHYHNDDLSYHFYADGVPISLDYNCGYTPRGDHAALHNTLTFGREGTVRNNQSGQNVPALEEARNRGEVLAFATSPIADVTVTERVSRQLTMYPFLPEHAEFQREYPQREVEPITHRRTFVLMKQPANSKVSDYLVVFDRVDSKEPAQVNVHLLARDLEIKGNEVLAEGQLHKDMLVHFYPVGGPQSLHIEPRAWFYHDDWLISPGEPFIPKIGESVTEWKRRLAREGDFPPATWSAQHKRREDEASMKAADDWGRYIQQTEGKALIIPPGWNLKTAPWLYGEYQKWVRVHLDPGQSVAWILYPYDQGGRPPKVSFDAQSLLMTVEAEGQKQEIQLGDEIKIRAQGQTMEVVAQGAL